MTKMLNVMTILFFSLMVLDFAEAGISGAESLSQISKKYRDSKIVTMNVDKVVSSELLGKETKYSGKIYFSSGKLRWENKTPEKTLIIFDGETIWSEQSPSEALGGPLQVARGKIDKKNKTQMLIPTILEESATKNFKVVNETKNGEQLKLRLESKSGSLGVSSLEVTLHLGKLTLEEVSYSDDIGNKTTLQFSNITMSEKYPKNLFKYKIPKGAQVTDL